ncbi:hypothetical protein [Rhizobium sp. CECT 9324]|jgi:hypothetical protein|uniref:hypothetical protein n=1 Tax=Rhizobium sp. CECT 9324 TaxID=2845820 RepID=UPI0013AEE4F8|nr:hypothetical protein [Rhizobium sp. CECT 9324]CAH0338447.1 hypothetical protein RHI9324_00069 [Rhizobium sp. CECT 9324]
MSNFLWLLGLVLGPVLVGAVIAYGMMQMRDHANNRYRRDALTGEIYGKDDR